MISVVGSHTLVSLIDEYRTFFSLPGPPPTLFVCLFVFSLFLEKHSTDSWGNEMNEKRGGCLCPFLYRLAPPPRVGGFQCACNSFFIFIFVLFCFLPSPGITPMMPGDFSWDYVLSKRVMMRECHPIYITLMDWSLEAFLVVYAPKQSKQEWESLDVFCSFHLLIQATWRRNTQEKGSRETNICGIHNVNTMGAVHAPGSVTSSYFLEKRERSVPFFVFFFVI